jgi:hypothetical protein
MRSIFTFAIVMLLAALAAPASAEFYAKDKTSKDPNRPAIEALAKEFASIPNSFGCTEFAWGHKDPTSTSMEFVPPGHDVRTWTRLVTITALDLPADEKGRADTLNRLQTIMLNMFTQRGIVMDKKTGTDKNGQPTLFVEYETGQGPAREHNAAAVLKLRPDLAAIVQIQSRGNKSLPREDAAKILALAIPKKN